ncbi:WD repeat-containing and planar cell polarity effector protein fritz isoform X2 [Cephus cinctus]|uniref:WD repeat-containing and planar cell polarity effector protein fritz isoform X2 n=1 Tax=Cephus cinctus TaxID=211228 RepID=A0AAJ7BI91_CEPCN|nr:WD repeat-containing and planar cell polarity effector protein fritz isoform X2 [Cephus cinctus]
MFVLLGEVNLWTFEDVINIKDIDFGAFRYHDKRTDDLYEEGKRSYAQKRGMVCVPQNKKGNKLKDSIKYLEEQLKDNSTVYCQWYDHCIVHMMLSSGLLVQIQINCPSGDIQKISFDKYLVGKVSDHISDVIITKNHLICTYNDSQVTLVHFTKPKRHIFEKISRLEPKFLTIDLSCHSGRRLDKKIQVNKSSDLILIWWKSTMNEVYPWSPAIKEHDRANVHLYRLTGTKLELLCYLRTEFDPLCITFNAYHENVIQSVEQKVSRKGEVTIEWRTYEVSQQDKLQRIAVISVPLPTHTSCVKFSPNHDMLLLCCIDGSITLHDQVRGTNNSVKAAFIPTLASWHSNGIIFAVGNERGQFQHFDISLSHVRSQMLSEDTTPANILDLSSYFRSQPALLRMEWNRKTDPSSYMEYYDHGDSLFLLLFERGPLGVIRIIEGDNLSGDVLVQRHLSLGQVERATSLLLSMNWDMDARACMHSLNQILNYLFKLPLTLEHENLIQNALGSFHIPVRPISQAVEEEYGDEVRDLTRRFFHHLLRYRLFEKAFRLAIDLNDHDLFMDIHFYALVMNDLEMATAAKEKAEQILSRSNSCTSSHSTCSRPSCSICSDSVSDKESESYSEESESEDSPKREKISYKLPGKRNYAKGTSSQIPPLPILHSPLYNSSGLVSTSFSDVPPINKSDNNLMSTPFNIPSSGLSTTAFNNSSHSLLSSGLLSSTSFSKLNSYTSTANLNPTSTISSNIFSQPFSTTTSDLMTVSFGNLTVSSVKPTTFNHLANNFAETSFNNSVNNTSQPTLSDAVQHNNFMSTPFNNPTYESVSVDIPSSLSSLDNTDNNVMSTSFSIPTTNLMPTLFGSSFPNLTATTKTESTATSTMIRSVKSSSVNPSSINIPPMPYAVIPPTTTMTNKTTSSASFNNAIGNVSSLSFYNCGSNLMSTSFNSPEEDISDSFDNTATAFTSTSFDNLTDGANCQSIQKTQHPLTLKKHTSGDIPPPPSITNSYHYIHNLPKKNYPLSRSTPGLTEIDEPIQKFQMSRATNIATSKILQRQNSVSSILQSQHKGTNFQPTRTYRLNYDLDFIPFHGSCDNLSVQHSHPGNTKSSSIGSINHAQSNYNVQSKSLEGKHLRLGFSQNSNLTISKDQKMSSNVPPLPVINLSTSNTKSLSQSTSSTDTPSSCSEKPKVKFSDTVTHILVPGTGQSYRPVQKRSVTQLHPMDPKRELAESLPLCLGNEDYLKDFQPLCKDNNIEKAKESPKPSEEAAKIKVVHFGLL